MKPKHAHGLVFPAFILAGSLAASFVHAASDFWDGGSVVDGNWSTPENWGSDVAPGDTIGTTNTDAATFNAAIVNGWGGSAGTPIVIDSSRNIWDLDFDADAGNYFIGSTGGNALLLSSAGFIQIRNTLTATNAIETINAPLVIQGVDGTYTFANDSANGAGMGAGTLNFGGGITGGAAGTTVLKLFGSNTNTNTISGIIANGTATKLSIEKYDPGTWELSGANTHTGGTTVSGGTLNINSIGALNSADTTDAVLAGGKGTLVLNHGATISNTSGAALTFVSGGMDHSTDATNKLVSITLSGSVTFDGAADGTKNMFFSRMGDNNVATVTLNEPSTVNVTNGIFNIGTKMVGAFSLTKNGVGELQAGNINNTLAFTGGLIVNEGTFTGSSPQKAFGNGTVSLGDTTPANSKNATLVYSSTTTNNQGTFPTNSLTVNAGSSGSLAFVTRNTNANNTTGLDSTTTVTLNNNLTLAATGLASTTNELRGVISGTGGLRIGDAINPNLGKVTLSGANTYTGATTITSGTLQLGAGSTTGTLSTSSAITNNANFTINRSNAVVQGTDFSPAAITGTGSLTQAGAGTLTLTAANTYTGATTVTAGTLQLGAGSTTGTLSTSSAIITNANFTINRSNAVVQGTDFSAAAITGTGSLTQAGAGTTTLNATNTYTGATTLTSGTLSVATIGNGGVSGNLGAGGTAPSNLVFNGGTLRYTGATASTNRNFTINAGTTATFDITANHLTVTGASTATNGALTKTGAGTLTLGGANTYTGATTISAGTLKLQAGVPAPTAPVAGYARWFDASTIVGTNGQSISTWTNGGTGGNATVPSGNSAPTLVSDAGTGTGLGALQFAKNTNATNSGALTFARDSSIRSVFSIFKGGAFLLTDTNTYQFHRGGTYNNSATDVLWDGAPTNYSSANIRNGTTYVNGTQVNGTTFAMPTNLNNGYNLVSMITNGNPVEANGFNKDRTFNSGNQFQAEVLIYDFALTNTQRLEVEAYLNAKWFNIGSATTSLSSASPVSVAASATLDLNGVTQQIASLSGPSGSSVTNSGITNSILTISGASNTDFGGVISNGGTNNISIAKSGAGIQTLSGTNTYTGTTTVSAGTLLVNGSNNGTGLVTVASGATLGGTGSIAAAINVTSVLSPGASIESLASGALTMGSGSTFIYEAANNTAAGADLMVVNGLLSLSGVTLDLSAANLGLNNTWAANNKITLISYTGPAITSGFNGYIDDATYTFGANEWVFNYNDTAKGANFNGEATGTSFVTFTIPEPRAALLAGLGMLALLRRRRSSN